MFFTGVAGTAPVDKEHKLRQSFLNRTMNALNVDEIKREASGRLEVAKKTEDLQRLVDRIYPGYRVVLSQEDRNRQSAHAPRADLSDLSGLEQIEIVLRENNGPMQLQRLLRSLRQRGSGMSSATVMSMLSKYGREGRFRRFARGWWGLPNQTDPTGTLHDDVR